MAGESESAAPHTVMFAQIRAWLLRVPFKPFRIVTTSGRAYLVPTADHASVTVKSRMIHHAFDDGDVAEIHALHVATVESVGPRRRRAA